MKTPSHKKGKTILVIFPHDYLTTIPTMGQVFDALIEHFDLIEVYGRCSNLYIERAGAPVDSLHRPISGLSPFRNWRMAGQFMRSASAIMLKLLRREYAAIIGVDPEGITLADRFNRYARLPLVYISFEILCKMDCNSPEEHELKKREIEASRKARVILIQDRERGDIMAIDNGLKPEVFVYAPVAPYPQAIQQTEWLRKKCTIPGDKAIVLLSGTIDAWTSRDLLPEIVRRWPEEFVLVIHNRQTMHSRLKVFLNKLTRSPSVYLTNQFVAQENLRELYASADIGFVPYLPNPSHWGSHLNTYHMGFASGKVGYFAMCGVPLLTTDLPVYKREFAEFQAGGCYTEMAEIPNLLRRINQNREFHGQEARRFYEERLNPEKGIKEFVDRLLAIAE